MARIKLIASLVVLGLFLVVVLQNTEVVVLRAFIWEVQMSRIILLTVPLILGFATGFATAKILSARRSRHP